MNVMKRCNENLIKAIESAKLLIELADEGDTNREDESCGVLFGVIRDSAYKIKTLAEQELIKHQNSDRWITREQRAVRTDSL